MYDDYVGPLTLAGMVFCSFYFCSFYFCSFYYSCSYSSCSSYFSYSQPGAPSP